MAHHPPRLLIVDDEATIRSLYTRLFSKAGYRVEVVPGGREALKALECRRFDLVLLDVHMPGIDGLAVLRELRGRSRIPPVLALSGCATFEEGAEADRLGAAVMQKGGTTELLARVEELLSEARERMDVWIENHLQEATSRAVVANHFMVCSRTVTNQVKLICGQTFSAFGHACRVREAQRLLTETDLAIKEIAACVGFRSSRTMSRAFRAQTGSTPAQYRRASPQSSEGRRLRGRSSS